MNELFAMATVFGAIALMLVAAWIYHVRYVRERALERSALRHVQAGGRGKYWVALHHTSEGYAVEALGLPGCLSQGRTEAEALANIEDVIREYLSARNQYRIDTDITGVEVREVLVG